MFRAVFVSPVDFFLYVYSVSEQYIIFYYLTLKKEEKRREEHEDEARGEKQ